MKMDFKEKTIDIKKIYNGYIIDVENHTVELPDGKPAPRDIVRHPGASVVIPVNDNGDVYMVRQFRKPLDKVLLELPAGKLDNNEDPLLCATRELKEETGIVADSIKHIISIHTTPGFCDEVIHMYIATGLKVGEACSDDDEFIESEKVHIDKLIQMIFTREITDAKTIIGIFLAQKFIHREIKEG
jgi:ADP-ribose pyrophosphatase